MYNTVPTAADDEPLVQTKRTSTLSTARRTNHILILIYTRAMCGDAMAHFKAELFRDWGFAAARARAEALKTVASRR